MTLSRPLPPAELDRLSEVFVRGEAVEEWIRTAVLEPGGPLHNPDHAHLEFAEIGVLWTTYGATRHQRTIVGMAETPNPRGHPWVKARADWQLREWFSRVPDFVITLSVEYARAVDDASWCALVEHELYHCAQAIDRWGGPKFTREGRPVFAIRGHDVEEFVGVVERYGSAAAGSQVQAMVAAAQAKPTVARASISAACGTCDLRVA